MSTSTGRYVVDASVGIKLFIVEPLGAQADAVFGLLTADPPARLFVPDLFYIECASILWKYVRRFGYPKADAQQAASDLVALDLRSVRTVELVEEALEIATTYSISAYDACYVSLAHRLGSALVTADGALARAFVGTAYAVQWLGDFRPGAGTQARPDS